MNRKVLLGVAAVVAVAAIVFWWTRRTGEADDAPAKPGITERGAAPDRGGDRHGNRRGDIDMPMRALIDDDPKGTLRLEGQVVDAEDHPVAGATVVLSSNPPRTDTTEADGGFAFDALVGRPYTLIARAPQGIAGPVTARLTSKSDPVVMKLHPAAKLTVHVTADGKPVDGATVELRGTDEQRETTRAGTAVFATVVPGGYQVAAWADGKARSFQWIQIGAGDAEAKLALQAGAAVSGRVIDEHGTGIAGARIRYSGASDWNRQASDRLDAVVSGADGAFKIDAMPAGSFRFLATHGEHAPGSSELVVLDGKTAKDGVAITMAAGATVRGVVVDAAKNPVASARVRVGIAGGPRQMIWEAPRQAYSDASGAFAIKGLPRNALLAVAMHESGASQTTPVDTTAGDADITLVIDVTGTIAGIVVDPSGQPMEGVQVTAGPNFGAMGGGMPADFTQWRMRGFPQELTDAGGKFKLTGLAPGSYLVSASSVTSASRGRRPGFGMGGGGAGAQAKTGDANVKIVLPPEGGVKGKVLFADGTAPAAFTVSAGMNGQQAFGGADGSFVIDALPPQKYELSVRGPSFQSIAVEVDVTSGKTADAGTITVAKGRTVGGVVLSDGQPVAGATVSVGRFIFGNGTSTNANNQFNPMAAGTKHDTTDASGAFMLSGFGEGDLAIVAEQDAIGRSRAMRLPTLLPGQTELTINLEKYGSLSGVVRSAGKPTSTLVNLQSTSTPGAMFGVMAGQDGVYRFDRLAPDTYKVSAMVGMPMTGMKFYSKQIDIPPGGQATIDLAVDPGAGTVAVTGVPRNGKLGGGTAWLATGSITAKTSSELGLKLAASGPGAYQLSFLRNGEPVQFTEVAPGAYTACLVPLPSEVRGMGAFGYAERHGDSLLAYCKTLTVAGGAEQAVQIPVDIPPFIPDTPPPGGGSGSGGPKGGGGGGSGSGGQ